MSVHRRHHPHTPQTMNDHLATLERAIRQLTYGQHLFTVFRHFVELSALSLSNVADPINKAARDALYLIILNQYTCDQLQRFPLLLGMVATFLKHDPTDVLGNLFPPPRSCREGGILHILGTFFLGWHPEQESSIKCSNWH